MKIYKSSYSHCMLVSTIIFMILLIYATYRFGIHLLEHSIVSYEFIGDSIAICIIVGSIIYAFTSQIIYVGVSDDTIIIKKKVGQIILSHNNILQIEIKKNIIMDIRLWGISGLFGHIGLFWNHSIGSYIAYVKNGDSMIVLRTIDKTYVISCDNHHELIKQINQMQSRKKSIPQNNN